MPLQTVLPVQALNFRKLFSETIIYRLVMRNYDLGTFSKKFNFWRENGRGRHAGAKGSRASRPDRKLAHREELLGQPLS